MQREFYQTPVTQKLNSAYDFRPFIQMLQPFKQYQGKRSVVQGQAQDETGNALPCKNTLAHTGLWNAQIYEFRFFYSSFLALWEKVSSCLESVIGGVYARQYCLSSLTSCTLPNNVPCLQLFLIVVKYLSRFPLVPHAWKNMWAQHLSKQAQNKMHQVEGKYLRIWLWLVLRYLLWRQGFLCLSSNAGVLCDRIGIFLSVSCLSKLVNTPQFEATSNLYHSWHLTPW